MHSTIKYAIALPVCAVILTGCFAPFKHQDSGFTIIMETQGELREFYAPDEGGDSITDRTRKEKYSPAGHYSAEFEYPTDGQFNIEINEKYEVDEVTGHNRVKERTVAASGGSTSTDATLTNINAQDRSGEAIVAGANAGAAAATAGATAIAQEAGNAAVEIFAEGNKTISEGIGERAGTPNDLPAIAASLNGTSAPESTEDNTEEVSTDSEAAEPTE